LVEGASPGRSGFWQSARRSEWGTGPNMSTCGFWCPKRGCTLDLGYRRDAFGVATASEGRRHDRRRRSVVGVHDRRHRRIGPHPRGGALRRSRTKGHVARCPACVTRARRDPNTAQGAPETGVSRARTIGPRERSAFKGAAQAVRLSWRCPSHPHRTGAHALVVVVVDGAERSIRVRQVRSRFDARMRTDPCSPR